MNTSSAGDADAERRGGKGKNRPQDDFDRLPDSAFVRLPTVATLWATHPATVWRKVKAGQIPQPVKLGPQTTAWRVGDLRAALAALVPS